MNLVFCQARYAVVFSEILQKKTLADLLLCWEIIYLVTKASITAYFFSGQFFGATIFLLSLSSAMTVLIMRVHFSGEHGGKVPRWLRKVVLVCLARVVRMHKSAAETCKVRWSFH